MVFVFPIMPMFRWIGAVSSLELEEPTAASKEGKPICRPSTVMLELCRRWRTVVCCARAISWVENPIRYQPAFPQVTTHAGRAFVTYFATVACSTAWTHGVCS